MRILLLETIKPDFAEQLSLALDLPLIAPAVLPDPNTGLFSDDRIIDSLIETIADTNAFIIDHSPRSVIQAQSLDLALARIGQPVSSVLALAATNSSQNRENKALIRYYRTQNKLILLDSLQGIDEICENIRLTYAKRRSASSDLAER